MKNAYSIKIFLPEGDPEGLRIIEKSNWNGRGLVCPRAKFSAARTRSEMDNTGVYILVGPDTHLSVDRVYIGEGDPAKPRLDSHHASKDFWQSFVLFTSKDGSLNKAHIQYLESRLITIAKQVNRCVLDNGNVPTQPSLSEIDKAEAEGFLHELLLCLPVLGVNFFTSPSSASGKSSLLYVRVKDITASGYETSEGLVVQKGSLAAAHSSDALDDRVRSLRESLKKQGVLVTKGNQLEFTQDYTFSAPSLASTIVLGRHSNGRVDWKDSTGRSLKEMQERQATSAARGQHA